MTFVIMANFRSYVNWSDDSPLVSIGESCPNDQGQDVSWGESDILITLADEVKEDTTEVYSRNKTQLCGYLSKYKLGARGIGKHFKRRWFVYSEDTCKLRYYRTPQDIVPLGEILIANATLSFEVVAADSVGGRNNVFEISSMGRVYCLEAADQQTMMYWLQQLQVKRRTFSHRKTVVSKATDSSQLKTVQQPCAGLVASSRVPIIDHSDEPCLPMPPVELPQHTVGEGSAATQSRYPFSDISISNWKTELRNVVSNIRRTSYLECNVPTTQPASSAITQTTSLPEESHTKLSRFQSLKRKMRSKSQDLDSLGSSLYGSSESLCGRCKQLEGLILGHQEDVEFAEDELLATRELLRILQKDLDLAQRKLKTQSSSYDNSPLHDHVDALQQKDKTIVDLEHLVALVKEEKEIDSVEFRMLESKVESLEQEMEMYRDSLRCKDEIVVSLTNEVFELEKSRTNASTNCKATNTTLQRKPVDTLEVERLRDAVSAYQLQNTFLNTEIIELNKLRSDDEARERQTYMLSKEWEAKYYQINSKYLLCLEELRTPRRGGEGTNQDMVTQLLKDVLESGEYTTTEDQLTSQSLNYAISTKRMLKKYDNYGFLIWPYAGDDLVEKANSLQRISDDLRNVDIDREVSQNVRWENVFASLRSRELQRTQELKSLIRKNGIPPHHKERVWNACISFQLGRLRERLGPRYYQNLLVQMEEQSHRHNPAVKQIELDLLRTLPNNRHYESISSDGIPKLKRVLRAYTQHNPDLGYCQGQNRLAAIALLFLNEEDAFWCLLAITEYLMPVDYYSSTLSAAQVDQRVLKDLMADKLPQLMMHMEALEIDISLFSFNWFLTIFVDNIPIETYLRVWDCFLYEGNKVLFRFALAFFKYREKEILAITENIELHNYLRTVGENAHDIDKISQIAFHDVNPLPMRTIETRRQTHMVQVKHELAELDALRSQFRSTRRARPREQEQHNDLLSDDDIC